MRVLAIILSGIGCYFLLRRLDFAFQIIPIRVYGSEGGLIEIGTDMIFGVGASTMATVLAFVHLVRTRGKGVGPVVSSAVLLAWCCLLLFGFVLCLWL